MDGENFLANSGVKHRWGMEHLSWKLKDALVQQPRHVFASVVLQTEILLRVPRHKVKS